MMKTASMPSWLANDRQHHKDAYLNQGLPSRKDERWKYADVSFMKTMTFTAPGKVFDMDEVQAVIDSRRLKHGESVLMVFVNGHFMASLSDQAAFPKEVIAMSMNEALERHPDLVKAHWPEAVDPKQHPFACLNAAEFTDGLFLHVPDNVHLDKPVHVLSIATDKQTFMANVRHLTVLGKNAKLTLLEEYMAITRQPYLMNIAASFVLEQNANLEHFKLQSESLQAMHLASMFVKQKQNSNADFINISTGAIFGRDDLVVRLLESGADCHASGFYQLYKDNQYIDHHVDISHDAPRSNSEMLYKGTVDKKSRAVFNGRLHVTKGSQKILAYQANHNLLLSNDAEVYSKPELEIYADDVKCKHGATTGQLDEDALFFMRSRGISRKDALSILLHAFSEEITRRIAHRGIKLQVQAQLLSIEAL